MKNAIRSLFISVIVILLFASPQVHAQTTGKISGTVKDEASGEPLIGANITIEGTNYGAAADVEGVFFILNIPPGNYTVKIRMMGYKTKVIESVRLSVNRTYELHEKLEIAVVEGEEIVVIADQVSIRKDQTSSIRNVSAEQMEILPTESISQVVNMQPGVVLGHFRGGRSNEVTYMIDGMSVDEAFGRGGRTMTVEQNVVEDLEVITGIFSAKYGNAMSGVVNAITKDGGRKFHGSVEGVLGNYVTPRTDIFIGLDNADFTRRKDFQFSLNGPIWGDKITFAANARFQDNKDHFNGIRRFMPDDYSNFNALAEEDWYSEHNGDDEYVAMGWNKSMNLWGKVTYKPVSALKLSLQYLKNDSEGQGYSHYNKYKPDGRSTGYHESQMIAFQANHMLSKSAFYEFKTSFIKNYNGNYVFENPLDSGYIHDMYARGGGGFATGGQDKGHSERWLNDFNTKLDFVWQIHTEHSLEAGVTFTQHDLSVDYKSIRNKYKGTEFEPVYVEDPTIPKRTYLYYEPVVMADSTLYSEIYEKQPVDFAMYFQDKMEFKEMVINLGLRYDYFDPATTYPTQLRNPANQLNFEGTPEKMSEYPEADPISNLSPRLGISYQLGQKALLRFGYGHFLQMPPLSAIYSNNARLIPPSDYSTTLGNPLLYAQKTIQYEVGLWQELMPNMSLEIALFYRDIYDLQSAIVVTTFNQIRYGLYSNKDYANARGLEVKYEFFSGALSAFLNYTLQYSRGNADNPTSTFSRAGAKMDPVNKMIPMSWDQRHTLNATLGYNVSKFGATLSGYYNSGAPYTWAPLADSRLANVNLFPNNAHRPSGFTADFTGFYNIAKFHSARLQMNVLIYNVFDNLNDVWVNSTTGRAYTAIIRETDIAGHRSNYNDVYDSVHNPSMYNSPRLVKIGLKLLF